MKLTGWHWANQEPSRIGVYERDYTNVYGRPGARYYYCFWNGKRWGCGSDSWDGAQRLRFIASDFQMLPWRGVAK